MRHPFAKTLKSTAFVSALVFFTSFTTVGCGDDDDSNGTPTATPTRTPTATATSVPTATPTPEETGHNENLFGSTQQGGGALTVDAAEVVDVSFQACLGGTGDTCAGGFLAYSASDPGFEEAEEDEPDEPLFVLADGVDVTLEITAIDPAVSLKFDAVTLNAVGQSVLLGTTPELHRDLEWQLRLPGGTTDVSGHDISLKLTTTSSQYGPSAEFTVTLKPASAGG